MPGTRKSTTRKSSFLPRNKPPAGGKAARTSKNGSHLSTGKILAATAGLAAAATAGAVLYKTKGASGNGRAVYHVQPDGEGWVVKSSGAERASSTHDTKKEALSAGRELAHGKVPSQLVVHGSDGKIQESWSYDA